MGNAATLDKPHNIIAYRSLSAVVKWATPLMICAAVSLLIVAYLFVPFGYTGPFLVLSGLLFSTVAAITMAIPSVPILFKMSARNRFLQHIRPAFHSLNKGQTVTKQDDGFQEMIYLYESWEGASFDEPTKIIPYKREQSLSAEVDNISKVATVSQLEALEIENQVFQTNLNKFRDVENKIRLSLEITCNQTGARILVFGFILQGIGVILNEGLLA